MRGAWLLSKICDSRQTLDPVKLSSDSWPGGGGGINNDGSKTTVWSRLTACD